MNLSNLHPAAGSKHSDAFRVGRGHGSGNGKTAGRGQKGQKCQCSVYRSTISQWYTWILVFQEFKLYLATS